MSSRGLGLKTYYQSQAREQWKEGLQFDRLEISIKLFFGDARIHDIDNYGKILLDSLTGIIWEDDKQIKKMTVEMFLDRENPRAEIEITKYNG